MPEDHLTPEDVELWRADPEYAATLGIIPRCVRCGEPIKTIYGPWDGGPVEHFVCLSDLVDTSGGTGG